MSTPSRSIRSLFLKNSNSPKEGTMIRSRNFRSNFSASAILLLALVFPSLGQLAGCGSADPVGECNPAVDKSCAEEPTDSGTPAPDPDSGTTSTFECSEEALTAEIALIPECPEGTYHDLYIQCTETGWLIDATCVQMEESEEAAEPFDCIGAFTLADALCDGTLAFECEASTGYVASICTPEAEVVTPPECPSPAEAAESCENGLASYSCDASTGSYSTECADAVPETAEVAECESAEETAESCTYGLSSYSCDGSTGSVDFDCADAPEESDPECPSAEDVDDYCSNGVSTYSCTDGDISVTCFDADTDGGTSTTTGACDDGIDNEGEGLVDSDDPDCHSDYDADNPASYDATLEEETYDALGNYSCCLDMNSDGRCTYTDGSGDIDGESYTGSDLWTYFNSYSDSYNTCVEWPDGYDDRTQDLDGDGYGPTDGDCNDGDDTAYPGADDVCDAYDNDCDGDIDENPDFDGDTHGDPGCSATGDDCDDSSASTYPGGGTDYPADGVDQDCSGTEDDVDLDGDCYCDEYSSACNSSTNASCATLTVGDCNDYDSAAYPGASDYSGDGYDADCDGTD